MDREGAQQKLRRRFYRFTRALQRIADPDDERTSINVRFTLRQVALNVLLLTHYGEDEP